MAAVAGIHLGSHDSSACLITDGVLHVGVEEERFTGVKHQGGWPEKALRYVLQCGNSNVIDALSGAYIENRSERLKNVVKIRSYKEHHLLHAYSVLPFSGDTKLAILTADRTGDGITLAAYLWDGNCMEPLWSIPSRDVLHDRSLWWLVDNTLTSYIPGKVKKTLLDLLYFVYPMETSIGGIYALATKYLEMGPFGEGKTMALASYGQPTINMSDILNITRHDTYVISNRKMRRLAIKYRRHPNHEPRECHKNLAASVQHALEKSIVNLISELYETTGVRKFGLAGGIFLNCKLNMRIKDLGFVDTVYVPPVAGDNGLSVGAAVLTALDMGERIKPINHSFLGPEYGAEEIRSVIKRYENHIEYHESSDAVGECAEMLADGKIVGFFQGRMEFGPRALGNRSILAHPGIKGIKDRINARIKHREWWRPFAPALTMDGLKRYYYGPYIPSPFMNISYRVREDKAEEISEVVHVDGTSRVQTVERGTTKLYDIIIRFANITGTEAVLNTSFNDRGEPIVNSPQEAMATFLKTGLDALVLGDWIVHKRS